RRPVGVGRPDRNRDPVVAASRASRRPRTGARDSLSADPVVRVLDEIRQLDPVRDHQRIVFLSTRVDFPFDTTRALELALFRTFGVPSISALLHRTGEFERRAQKRYDDTDIIVSEMMEHGYDSERGRA